MKKSNLYFIFIFLIPICLFGNNKMEVCPVPWCVSANTICIEDGFQVKKAIQINLFEGPGCPISNFEGQEITYIFASASNVQLFSINGFVSASNPQILIASEFNQLEEGTQYKVWRTLTSGQKASFSSDFPECSTSSNPIEHQFCCTEDNLMWFSNFEHHVIYPGAIPSSYVKENYFGENSISPGEYGLLSSNQAANVNPNWLVADHSSCGNNNGKILLVNGKTGQTGKKVIWRGVVASVKPDKKYKFCANFKNLGDSDNDIKPNIDIKFSGSPEFDIIGQEINVNRTDPCNWYKVTKELTFTSPRSLVVWIYLDETPVGAGNDLAIDDISFQEMPSAPQNFVLLDIQTTEFFSNYYTIHVNPINLPSNWPHYWEVCQIDENGNCIESTQVLNPSQWFGTPETNFNGYVNSFNLSGNEPGQFLIGKKYRIKFGTWSDCNKWTESKWEIGFDTSIEQTTLKIPDSKNVKEKFDTGLIQKSGSL